MKDAYADAAVQFIAREAAREERRAALLSRADERGLDAFGFSSNARSGHGNPPSTRDARKRRLQIARWWARARREWEADVAACRRRACQEFAVDASASDGPQEAGVSARWTKDLARLLVIRVEMQPRSERGEERNGAEVMFEIEACAEPRTGRLVRPNECFAEMFGWPSRSHADSGTLVGRRLARLGLATRVIGPDALGRVVSVGWQDMVGRRLLAAVRRKTLTDDAQEIVVAQIEGLKMWPADGGNC